MAGYGGYGGGGYSGFDQGFDTSYGNYGPPMPSGPEPSGADEMYPRTIYVGNLDPTITEDFVAALFTQIGPVSKCKIIQESGSEPYAFVEFMDHATASQALTAFNKRMLFNKEMKVNWATQPGTQQKVDTSKHHHIFVGDLSPEVDNKALRDAFAPFGEISDAKVIRDLQTLKSKGYGFVSFVNKEEAERAIEQMNGQWLGRRTIRTNWATRKPMAGGRTSTFEEVYNQASPTNMTVYVGGITPNTTECSEDDIRKVFAKYGTILEIRIFKQQGYAFVRFDSKESAAHSIVNLNGAEINGSPVRCSWGRQGDGGSGTTPGGPMSAYGYGYGYGGGNGGGAAAAPPNMQQAAAWQYWQQCWNNPGMMQQWQNYWQGSGQ